VTVSNFLQEMEKASSSDLSGFKGEWLENTGLPYKSAKKILIEKSSSLALLNTMDGDFEKAQGDAIDYVDYWNRSTSVHLKKYILEKHFNVLPDEILDKAFASDTPMIRQTLALKVDSIPTSRKTQYESLLKDRSYITLESALFKLWASFPEDRKEYLNATKDIVGLPNKNVKLLWLTLAILTNDYEAINTQGFFAQLSSYTAPHYSWEIRMGAFQYLSEIGFNDQSLKSLIEATTHHSWQFKKYARNLIDELLKDSDYKNRIENSSKELNQAHLRYINTKLGKE